MDKLIQFLIAVAANLVALALYAIVTYVMWRTIW
jgi:hypothetical protein